MTSLLIALPVAAPLAAAGLLLVTGRERPPTLTRGLGWGASTVALVASALLLTDAMDGPIAVLPVGGWPPGIAIVLVADVLSTLLVAVSALLVLLSLVYAAATGEDGDSFVPSALVLSAGVYGALLTGDLFNLFVFIEVMLVPSYVLLVHDGGAHRLAAGRRYLAVNLLGSTIFLAGVGLLYGTAGTVNLAELAGAGEDPAAALATGVVVVALAVKAAVVPLHSWLPSSYAVAGPAVVVLLSGLLTKVGVYALYRVYAVVYDGDPAWAWLIGTLAIATMVVGVLGAVGERSMRSVLTFHMVSQIGYLIVGLALFTLAGLTAGIFFFVQYVLVKAALLMVAGALEVRHGSDDLGRLSGLGRQDPALAVAFGVSALALVGVPPLSGFVAKLQLLGAALSEDRALGYVAATTILVVSLLTLTSMLKLWNAVFAQPPVRPADTADTGTGTGVDTGAPGETDTVTTRTTSPPLLVAPALLLAAAAVILGLWAEPLMRVSEAAAQGLLNSAAYAEAVLS